MIWFRLSSRQGATVAVCIQHWSSSMVINGHSSSRLRLDNCDTRAEFLTMQMELSYSHGILGRKVAPSTTGKSRTNKVSVRGTAGMETCMRRFETTIILVTVPARRYRPTTLIIKTLGVPLIPDVQRPCTRYISAQKMHEERRKRDYY